MRRFLIYFPVYLFLHITPPAFSQSNAELLRLGDESFEQGNYASAAYFYKQLLMGLNSGITDEVYPFQFKRSNRQPKEKKEEQLQRESNDSTDTADVVIQVVQETVESDSGNTKITISEQVVRMAYVMQRLAESYRLYYDYEKAEYYYKQLSELHPEQYPEARYWYACMLLSNSKYDSAEAVLTDYLVNLSDIHSDAFTNAEFVLKQCGFAKKTFSHPDKKTVVRKANDYLNEGNSNFAATFFPGPDNILFTSAREGSKTLENPDPERYAYTCDLFTASRTGNIFAKPLNFGHQLNTFQHEGAAVLSPNGKKLFFTRWSDDGEGAECAIYVCRKLHHQWLTPQKLNDNVNLPGYTNMQPALSADGKTLYFVSDRPGGSGGLDIWYCDIDEFDMAGEARNLGTNVNTSGDEVTPFFHGESNTLFFSSDGHLGMGGLDIFKTYPDNDFGAPVENLGVPVNSSRNDVYYVIDKTRENGYLTSDREGCGEYREGSCYSIYTVGKVPVIITMSGKVYDKETNEIIANSLVFLKEVYDRIEPLYAFTDENGDYSLVLRKNFEYYVTAQKSKYFKDATSVSTLDVTESKHIEHDFYLEKIPSGDIVIPGIEYDYDKATLRPESKIILDDLVDFLTLNDHVIIEISSHTDVRGSDEYNMELSQERAKSVVDYLIAHGIAMHRLTAKGYGESKLLVENARTEEEHQRNRRTAFRVLSEDYQPIDKIDQLKKKK